MKFLICFLFIEPIFNSITKFDILLNSSRNSLECLDSLKYLEISTSVNRKNIRLTYKKFTKFSQLKTSCYDYSKIPIYSMLIEPDKDLILDSSFNFNKTTKVYLESGFFQSFNNIKGIDINCILVANIFPLNRKSRLFFYYSRFNLYSNGKILESCRLEKSVEFLENVEELQFSFTNKYSEKTYPILFLNKSLIRMSFNGIINVFVKKNILNFVDIETFNQTYNFSVGFLFVKIYNIKLDHKLIHKKLYNGIKLLNIEGHINSVDKNFILMSFKNLKTLNLNVYLKSIYIIFYESNKWLLTLDFKLSVNIRILDEYTYPNSDICLFYNLPKISGLQIFSYKSGPNCTCTKYLIMAQFNRSTYGECRNFRIKNYTPNDAEIIYRLNYEKLAKKFPKENFLQELKKKPFTGFFVLNDQNNETIHLDNVQSYLLFYNSYSSWDNRTAHIFDIWFKPSLTNDEKYSFLNQLVSKLFVYARDNLIDPINYHILECKQNEFLLERLQWEEIGAIDLSKNEGWLIYEMDLEQMKNFLNQGFSKLNNFDISKVTDINEYGPKIHKLIHEMSIYEKMEDQFKLSIDGLIKDYKYEDKMNGFYEAMVVFNDQTDLIGHALYYRTYELERGVGCYIEELYIQENYRRMGLGKILWKELIEDCLQKFNVNYMQWAVLDWNSSAVNFYEKCGAKLLENLRLFRFPSNRIYK
ncbi:unnamed protein product [Brachionus calyciflorus]|uniref:N-acetyltransferase domain-containing protein n=1 Tax=Brachionus calyciflorus TaxID=104777 RepID=A0A814BMG2_9BILA|nr:unnamed protein product [Brachionus calyciflorus]